MASLRGAVIASLFLVASADLASFLDTQKGQTKVDCKAVCAAVGTAYSGMGMSRAGDVSTYTCTCGGKKVAVACTGSPFIQCCKDKCEGTTCPNAAAGWKCPATGGCDGGNCTGANWKEWVSSHNIYRCMHNVPPVSWNNAVFEDTEAHFTTVQKMVHSKCYEVKAPAGPAGENLFIGTGTYSPLDAVKAWYSEIKDCGAIPGCSKGAKGAVGHFTAMIWNGDKTIGCFNNKYNLWGCRYKAGDFASCNTPNYGGEKSYPQNVFPKVKTFTQCLAEVKKCGLPEPKGAAAIQAIGYDELNEESFGFSAIPFVTGAFAVLAVGLVVGSTVLGVRRMARGQKLKEALVQDEAKVEMACPE